MSIENLLGKVPPRAINLLDQIPYTVTYVEEAVDFGAGNSSFVFKTPIGRRGKVLSVDIYNVTETFNSVTTAARVDIGDGSDADEFVLTDDLADGTAAQSFNPGSDNLTDGDTPIIDPNDQVTVTCVAPTGGVPTGIASVAVTVLYFR